MNDRFKFRVFNKLWDCYSMDDFYIDEDGDLLGDKTDDISW